MNTSEYITFLQTRLGGQFSRNVLLQEVNVAQNEVLALPNTPWARAKGDVFLATTEDVFEYTLPVGVRAVGRIYVRQSDINYNDNVWNNNVPLTNRTVGTKNYYELDIPFDIKESYTPDDSCILYFNTDQDLGTTTNIYRLDRYDWPDQLTSESIAMTLPDPVLTTLVYYIVAKRVQESAYGVDIYNDPQVKAHLSRWVSKEALRPQQNRPTRIARF